MPVLPLIGRGRRDQRSAQDMDNAEFKQTSNTNPWKEIERTVRTVDEEKVKDCTEDVDALLVFAGLYSAVLTAFLIESYKTLQYDPTQDYLRQIALQTSGYTLTNGQLNATRSFQPQTFQAPEYAMRVNVCWFSSLLLSLSSASFGILVKQWLREFLAIPYISPQERVRIRAARAQGLEDWKLFEIASLLPVLLQISLALFFVGLCFFTAAVHPSIGTTSLLLVCCWAFLFCLSVIAPLVSPRCPYKTTALKAVFRHARPHATSFLQFLHRYLDQGISSICHVIMCQLNAIRLCFNWLRRRTRGLNGRSTSTNPEPTGGHVDASEGIHVTHVELSLFDPSHDLLNLRILARLLQSVTDSEADGQEEDYLRRTEDNDAMIFHNFDDLFLDDTLLARMSDAILLRSRPVNDMLPFVAAVVQSRLELCIPEALSKAPPKVPWPWTLAHSVRSLLADALAESMCSQIQHDFSIDWWELLEGSEWSTSLAFIVLLANPNDIPSAVPRLIHAFTQNVIKLEFGWNPLDVFSYQIRSLVQRDDSWPVRSLILLAQSLDLLKAEEAARCLAYVVHVSFIDPTRRPDRRSYGRLLERARADTPADHVDAILPSPQSIAVLLSAACVILHKYTLEQTESRSEFPSDIEDLLKFLPYSIPIVEKRLSYDELEGLRRTTSDDLPQVLTNLFTTPHTVHSLLEFFVRNPRHLLIPTDPWPSYHDLSFPELVGDIDCSRGESISILSNCASFFSKAAMSPGTSDRCALLRVCYLVYRFPTVTDDEVRASWHRMFAAAVTCIRSEEVVSQESQGGCFQEEHTETCNVAFAFLNWIHRRYNDGHDEPSEAYIQGAISLSRVPNDMITFLRRCVCNAHAVDPDTEETFWRIKHLEDLDRTASHGGAQAGPSRETGDPESESNPTTITGALGGSDAPTDSSEPLHVTAYSSSSESASEGAQADSPSETGESELRLQLSTTTGAPESPDAPDDSPDPRCSVTDIPPPDLQALSDPTNVAGSPVDDNDTSNIISHFNLPTTTNDALSRTSSHTNVAGTRSVANIDTSDPRRQSDIGELSDRSKTPSPLPEAGNRAMEGDAKELGYVPARVYQAVTGAADIVNTTPVRLRTTEEEVTAGSSETASTHPGQLLHREADQSFTRTSDGPMAPRAGNSPQEQTILSAQSAERGENSSGVDEEIQLVLLPSSSRPPES